MLDCNFEPPSVRLGRHTRAVLLSYEPADVKIPVGVHRDTNLPGSYQVSFVVRPEPFGRNDRELNFFIGQGYLPIDSVVKYAGSSISLVEHPTCRYTYLREREREVVLELGFFFRRDRMVVDGGDTLIAWSR